MTRTMLIVLALLATTAMASAQSTTFRDSGGRTTGTATTNSNTTAFSDAGAASPARREKRNGAFIGA
jgi:hypothetical protein